MAGHFKIYSTNAASFPQQGSKCMANPAKMNLEVNVWRAHPEFATTLVIIICVRSAALLAAVKTISQPCRKLKSDWHPVTRCMMHMRTA